MIDIYHAIHENHIILAELGPEIKVNIRYSIKGKRIAIRITKGLPELVLPSRNIKIHTKAGYIFLIQKESWIRKKLQQIKERIGEKPPCENIIPIFEQTYQIKYIEDDIDKVEIKEEVIYVYSPDSPNQATLVKFLKDTLLVEIMLLAESFSKIPNMHFSKIRITNNKSRWGSCSSTRVLAFSWRLIFAPKEVLKYLVVHEMCHLVEMNHSSRFWNLVEKLYPDYKIARLWLKKNSTRLDQYLKNSH